MSIKQLEKLKADGKIRDYVVSGGRGAGKNAAGAEWTAVKSGAKEGLKIALMAYCYKKGVPLFVEQRFHGRRKWRFDWLIPLPRPIAIEYEGLTFKKSGHTNSDAYSDNTDKYREAAKAGIIVLRYTYLNWRQCTNDLETFFL